MCYCVRHLHKPQTEIHGDSVRGDRSQKTERRTQLFKKKSGGEGGWRPWDFVRQAAGSGGMWVEEAASAGAGRLQD